MDKNEIEGAVSDVKGKVKDGLGGLTGDVGLQAEGKVDQLTGKIQSNFGATADKATKAANDAVDQASGMADRAGQTLRDAAGYVRNEAQHIGETVSAAGSRANEVVGRTVQQQPLLSLLGIAALGYLAGFLVHSKASPLAPPPPMSRYRRIVDRY